jgi:hypothetical protein
MQTGKKGEVSRTERKAEKAQFPVQRERLKHDSFPYREKG